MNAEAPSDKTQKQLFDPPKRIAEKLQSLSTSVGEIATLYGISPSDALDAVIGAGCRRYWWEGNRYDAEGVRRLVNGWSRWDTTPEVEIDLTPEQQLRLDQALGEEYAAVENTGSPREAFAATGQESQKPIRRFVASELELPSREETGRREKMG